MKKLKILFAILLMLGVTQISTDAMAQRGYGMMGPDDGYRRGYGPPQDEGWFCPNCGAWQGGGRNMERWRMGRGMGPGMMHRGWGQDRYYDGRYEDYDRRYRERDPYYQRRDGRQYQDQRRYRPGYQSNPEPLQKEDAESVLKDYLKSSRNPNLKLGKIEEKDDYFQAEIVTKDGSLVDEIQVDKKSGWLRSVY